MYATVREIVEHHLARNIPEYLTFAGALAIAAVCTMPEKCPVIIGPVDTPIKQMIQDLWAWFRNAIQTAIPAARGNRPATGNPTQPANPAQLKEGESK
jgi:hypothetical protein